MCLSCNYCSIYERKIKFFAVRSAIELALLVIDLHRSDSKMTEATYPSDQQESLPHTQSFNKRLEEFKKFATSSFTRARQVRSPPAVCPFSNHTALIIAVVGMSSKQALRCITSTCVWWFTKGGEKYIEDTPPIHTFSSIQSRSWVRLIV